jgi:hypothetical protein
MGIPSSKVSSLFPACFVFVARHAIWPRSGSRPLSPR